MGNTVYSTDFLNSLLDIKKGDVYNQKYLNKRLSEDESSVGNQYWDHGYLFYNLQPTEVNIVGDSVDLEMRIYEGQQARIKRVRINGNDRIYENVVRRELRTKPGDLFSKAALMRTARDLASMGHFDPESVNPEPKPKLRRWYCRYKLELKTEIERPNSNVIRLGTDGCSATIRFKTEQLLYSKSAEKE